MLLSVTIRVKDLLDRLKAFHQRPWARSPSFHLINPTHQTGSRTQTTVRTLRAAYLPHLNLMGSTGLPRVRPGRTDVPPVLRLK